MALSSKDLAVVRQAMDIIKRECELNPKCTVRDLGTFQYKVTEGRERTNPQTREPIYCPPTRKLVFKAAKSTVEEL